MDAVRVSPDRETSVMSDGFDALDVCHRKTLVALGRLAGLFARLTKIGADEEARVLASVVRPTVVHLSFDGSESGLGPRDLGQDVRCAGRPDESLGTGVVLCNVQIDGQLELGHAGEAVALDAVLGDVAKRIARPCSATTRWWA